ncbi:MAG TPA: aromatic ring-hydroxylating dioxygenase subunit alpha [Bdellovibrionales bacterium]|nr:aromatic ring-hydroxylating dioxygenase subunit alpha [Bdellovibrionales bacterium]
MDFKDFWYVVAESKKLKPGVVLGRKVLGEWLAVFRDEHGKPVALQDRCLHRSAQISKGRLKDGKLTCPYHGWTYNGEGQVVAIPSEGPEGHLKLRRCAKRFAILEKDDYVYVRLTDTPSEELLPFDIPHYKEKGWKTIRLTYHFKNNVTNCVENFVDVPHTVFVHPTIFRNSKYQKFGATVKRENGAVQVEYKHESGNLGIFSKFLNPSGREIVHRDNFYMPNVTCVEYIFGPSRHFFITSQSVPETDDQTLVYTDLTYNYGIWNFLSGPIVRKQARIIIEQDVEILNNQMETLKRYGDKFNNSSADVIHVLIESIRNEIEKGGDPRKLPPKTAEIEFWV